MATVARLLESGQFRSMEELAHAVKLDSSYVGRILRLTLLAPDIIMAILEGREPSGLSLGKLMKTLPSDWVEQRAVLGFPAVEEKYSRSDAVAGQHRRFKPILRKQTENPPIPPFFDFRAE